MSHHTHTGPTLQPQVVRNKADYQATGSLVIGGGDQQLEKQVEILGLLQVIDDELVALLDLLVAG